MRKTKKLLSWLLVIVMLFSAFPNTFVNASETSVTAGTVADTDTADETGREDAAPNDVYVNSGGGN